MQAIILSAGKGTRMKELTASLPKPMLRVAGKTLLEHKFDALPAEVDEIILVVGYLGEVIRSAYGDAFQGKKITYLEQTEVNGTGSAVWLAQSIVKDRFLVMMGDDIYSTQDIQAAADSPDWALVVARAAPGSSGGKMVQGASGAIEEIREGTHDDPEGFLVGTNLFALDRRVFSQALVPAGNGKAEFGLPQTVLAAAKTQGIPLHAIEATKWIQVTAPEDLKKAEEILKQSGP